ncbi:MAG: NUDIX domain-containing protein [Deltaproteobacteria bacterium]|nr:NUDIX domain-containing protein [Deltaproteobacteria bacterium]
MPGALLESVPLEATGRHRLRFVDDRVRVEADDDRSALRHALQRHLKRRAEGEDVVVVLGDRVCARFSPGLPAFVDPLTAFEARFLADNDVPLSMPPAGSALFAPRTDLHTHFAAALPGVELIRLAAAAGLTLSREQLQKAGVDDDDADSALLLRDLPAAALDRLAHDLDVPLQQITFQGMEALYGRRSPLTKHPALFVDQLWAIARGFARDGVEYAELSLSTCLDPLILGALHEHLEDITAATGVRLRFLVALRRDDDLEWDLDVMVRLAQCLLSRAIVGVDIMGHETCSTKAFLPVLRAAGALGCLRPGFVVRVHAGENPAFPENVREAVAALLPCEGIEIRIGHGLYGVDDGTLLLMAAQPERVLVEFNLGSNLSLNNIQATRQVPIRRYLDAGVSAVLGTDGAGLYGTCARDEVRAALACDLAPRHFERLRDVETALLGRREIQESKLPALSSFAVPPASPHLHWTPAVSERRAARGTQLRKAQDERLQEFGAVVVDRAASDSGPDLAGRPLLWLAAAWRKAIVSWTDAELAHARGVLDGVIAGLKERGGVLLTGGSHHGVEGMAHELAERHQVDVVGAIVDDTLAADLDGRVRWFWRCARTLHEKADAVVRFARDQNALGLFVGGGLIVADEQQAAHNLAVRHVVLLGLPGPAVAAALASETTKKVADAAGVLLAFDDKRPRGRLRDPGPNDAADVVVLRRGPRSGQREMLVVRRHDHSGALAGRLCLPGGFLRSGESPAQAAARELKEEAGLAVDVGALVSVGVVAGGGRDPRDTPERWVRAHVFVVVVEHDGPLIAGSDAAEARFEVVAGHAPLAFDHDRLVERALERLSI